MTLSATAACCINNVRAFLHLPHSKRATAFLFEEIFLVYYIGRSYPSNSGRPASDSVRMSICEINGGLAKQKKRPSIFNLVEIRLKEWKKKKKNNKILVELAMARANCLLDYTHI